MAGIKSLIGLALAGSAGLTLLILACTLHPQNWWPAVVTVFYLLVPLPILVAKQLTNTSGGFGSQSNQPKEWAYFLTTGIVISALALPIILCRVEIIEASATLLSLASSAFFFSTILAIFIVFQSDDNFTNSYY